MAHYITGKPIPAGAQIGKFSSTALLPLGYKANDEMGNEYIYVGASGITAGKPVKRGSAGLSNCVVGTAACDVVGVAQGEFVTTGFTYGFIGDKGLFSTLVPSGTALGAALVGGNGTMAVAAAPSGLAANVIPSLRAIANAAAADAGTAIDVLWL